MFPKIIWRYWGQGWEQAPNCVKLISESVDHYAKDWEIHNLDDDSLTNYIMLPEIIDKIPNYPIQTKSDLIRILLLQKYGGVWLDATVFLNRSLTEWFKNFECEFFYLCRERNGKAPSSWFLASIPNGYVVNRIVDTFQNTVCSQGWIEENEKYFGKRWKGSPNYFIFHKLMDNLLDSDEVYRNKISLKPHVDNIPKFYNQHDYFKRVTSVDVMKRIDELPCFKFKHNVNDADFEEGSLLSLLLNKMKGRYVDSILFHTHHADSLEARDINSAYVNRPNVVGKYAGQFNSESDLRLCQEKYSKYHIYNFSDPAGKNSCQILIPYNTDRVFIRHQTGGRFSTSQELALKKDVNISGFENYIFWQTHLALLHRMISHNSAVKLNVLDFHNGFVRIFINCINSKIHYELKKINGGISVQFHCEDGELIESCADLFEVLALIFNRPFSTKGTCIIVENLPCFEFEHLVLKYINRTCRVIQYYFSASKKDKIKLALIGHWYHNKRLIQSKFRNFRIKHALI